MPAHSKPHNRGGRGRPPATPRCSGGPGAGGLGASGVGGRGVPRRHASFLGFGSLFGDGAYSENIYVGGVLVQPVAEHEYRVRGQSNPTQSTYYGPWSSAGLWDNSTLAAGCWIGVWPGAEVWAQADLPGPMSVSKIILRPRSDNYYARHCSAYRLEGWDGSAWVVVSSKTGITSAQFGWGISYTDVVNSAVQISKVRLVLTAMQAGNDGYFEIGELEMYEKLTGCIVITGAATVAPDAVTGAAGFSCRNIVLDGASASLTPTVNCKGLLGFCTGKAVLLNGAKMHMDRMGKAGNFGNLTAYTLAPASIRRKLKKTLHDLYTVQGEGAAGAAAVYQPTANFSVLYGATPAAAGAMQTGGGGPGAVACHSVPMTGAKAGKGGPCCGGAAGAILVAANQGAQVPVTDSGDYGGPAGPVTYAGGVSNTAAGGTPGDPVGAPYQGSAALGGGGGLLMLFAGGGVSIGVGCIASSDGSPGGNAGGFTYNIGASGAGGGLVCIVVPTGMYSNLGTVRAAGGAPGSGGFGGSNVGGGLGSVNIFQNAV